MSAHPAAAPKLGRQPLRDRLANAGFRGLLLFSLALGIVVLIVLLQDVFRDGISHVGQVVSNMPSGLPSKAGAQSAIWGTIWLMVLVAAFTIPVGVGAALYLEEYADKNRWWNRLIDVNIQNLAAVPSIVYGILGLAFIVRGFLGFGQTILSGALTLSLLVLPIVMISAREAVKAVPDSIRQGALALGATKWQTIWRQVLPAAIPGIATGTILSLSRAIGEAAPLLLLGALTFVSFNPSGPNSAFTALPIQIFNWISRPQDDFKLLAAGAILVLLAILLTMNGLAIFLRNKYQRKW